MKLIHTENYEAMSKEAADLLLDTLRKNRMQSSALRPEALRRGCMSWYVKR